MTFACGSVCSPLEALTSLGRLFRCSFSKGLVSRHLHKHVCLMIRRCLQQPAPRSGTRTRYTNPGPAASGLGRRVTDSSGSDLFSSGGSTVTEGGSCFCPGAHGCAAKATLRNIPLNIKLSIQAFIVLGVFCQKPSVCCERRLPPDSLWLQETLLLYFSPDPPPNGAEIFSYCPRNSPKRTS